MPMIYLDNNATTATDPRVVESMLPFLRDQYANPSSVHYFGQRARHAVETAREQVAAAIGAQARQIVFTGSGTEANNMAIRGVLSANPEKRHVVITAVEHDSIIRLANQLEREQFSITRVGVNPQGNLDLAEFEAALTDQTALACAMHANNETGVVFPIAALGRIAEDRGVPLLADAVQTLGKLPFVAANLPVSILTMAAHKFHGPKGVGAIYLKRGTRIRPQIFGGHQERDLRAGTENVPGIVGTGLAAEIAITHLREDSDNIAVLRDRFEHGVLDRVPGARVIGDRTARLPNTTNIGFECLQAEVILMLLSDKGLCASSGSACSSGSLEPSHVLAAMDVEERIARGAVRFSLSRFTTQGDIDSAIRIVTTAITDLQKSLP